MELKERIRKVRGTLTQRECARHLGIHTSTWQQYEFGNVHKGDILQKIHKKFHVDLNWLLTGQGEAYTGLETETGHIADAGAEYKAQSSLFKKTPLPAGGKGSPRRKGESLQGISTDSLSREELALIRSLRLCGDEYRKRVYNAVSIRAKNVLEEKTLEPEKSSELREDGAEVDLAVSH